jgi:hypothetical protein
VKHGDVRVQDRGALQKRAIDLGQQSSPGQEGLELLARPGGDEVTARSVWPGTWLLTAESHSSRLTEARRTTSAAAAGARADAMRHASAVMRTRGRIVTVVASRIDRSLLH